MSDELIRTRIAYGWHPEEALTEPLKSHLPRKCILSAFGETKAVADWAEDTRCVVMLGTLRKRLRDGWEVVKALTTPRREGHMLSAWGETKTLAAWSRNLRAQGGLKTLRWRLHQGWGLEEIVAGR